MNFYMEGKRKCILVFSGFNQRVIRVLQKLFKKIKNHIQNRVIIKSPHKILREMI